MPTNILGTTLNNRFRIDQEVGGGAVATVYRGTDLQTNTTVAIKRLLDTAKQADEAQITRFERESQAMETLSHPNIVNVIDTIFVGNDHFIVMDYVDGGSLADLMKQQTPLDVDYAIRIAHDIASAMVLVHDEDIIHRDIKPDNVLIGRDRHARLTDFGMARFTYMSRLTQKDLMVGSLMYMAPEQFRTGEAVKQSDIWQFGIMFYEILTGEKPFKQPGTIISLPHTPLTAMRPEVSPELSALMDKLLEKDPKQRIRRFDDVVAELENLM